MVKRMRGGGGGGGGRFNIKMPYHQYRIPIILTRRSRDRLIFIMEILYLETPSLYWDSALVTSTEKRVALFMYICNNIIRHLYFILEVIFFVFHSYNRVTKSSRKIFSFPIIYGTMAVTLHRSICDVPDTYLSNCQLFWASHVVKHDEITFVCRDLGCCVVLLDAAGEAVASNFKLRE